MQAHHFHQHLIRIGGTVKRAGARSVVSLGLRLQQRLAPDLALSEQLADLCFLGVWEAGGHRAAGDEDRRQVAEVQGTDQQSRHDLVADAEAQHRVERVMG